MSRINRLLNRYLASGFLVNSLPKSGTHLLAKAVALFPAVSAAGLHIGQASLAKFGGRNGDNDAIMIGVDWPHAVSRQALHRALRQVGKAQYATGHIPYSSAMATLLAEVGLKSLLMLRDPRDVALSHARHVTRTRRHFLSDYYQDLSDDQRIMTSIGGVTPEQSGGPRLLNIYERCQSLVLWRDQALNYTTTFEKLVGPQGGGSLEVQLQELTNIARHLDIRCRQGELAAVAGNLFGGTNTFRKGVIGAWRQSFSEAHKVHFKAVAGRLLIDLGYEKDDNW